MDEKLAVLGGMGCSFVLSIASIVLTIFYLLSLMRALQACSPTTRTMEPGLVWLNLVPMLNLFWTFLTVVHIGNSLRREYQTRGLARGGSFGKPVGIILYTLNLLALPLSLVGGLIAFLAAGDGDEQAAVAVLLGTAVLEGVIGVAGIALFITYWVQIAGFTRRLNADSGSARRDGFDDQARDDRREDEFDENHRPI